MVKRYFRTKDIHQKAVQEKLMIPIENPAKFRLIMKLLGIDKKELSKIYNKKLGKKYDLESVELKSQKLRDPDKTLDNYYINEPKLLNFLRDKYEPESKYKKNYISISWIEDEISYNGIKTFTLEQRSKLAEKVKKSLGNKIDKKNEDNNFLNLIILLPTHKIGSRDEKLGWRFFEKTLDIESEKQIDLIALVTALQAMSGKDNRDKTCNKIIEETCLNKFFTVNEKTLNNIVMKEKFISDIPDKKDFEDSKIILKSEIKPFNKDEEFRTKRVYFNEENIQGKNKYEQNEDEFELEFGLRFLISQVPGVLVNLRIPLDTKHELFNKNKSRTLILSPTFWHDFISSANNSEKNPDRDGGDERHKTEHFHLYVGPQILLKF